MAQITANQLHSHLARQLAGLYVLHGEEPLQQLESADAVRKAVGMSGEVDRTTFVVSGAHFDWSQVLAALSAQSLFAQKQVVEIRIPSAKPGKEGGVALQQLAQAVAQQHDTVVVISLPQRLDRASKNTAWFKALSEAGVAVSCDPVERGALSQWLTQRLAVAGLTLSSGEEGKRTLAFLVDHVEGNLLAAHQEIEKMSLLYRESGQSQDLEKLSFEQVKNAVMDVARYDLFSLTPIILSGQVERAMRMLDGLVNEGQAAVRIHWALSDEIMALWRVRKALDSGQPLPLALREARVWGVKERLYERIVPQLSSQSCLRLVRHARLCDGIVKGLTVPGWPDAPLDALRRLVLEMLDVVSGQRSRSHQSAQSNHLALSAS